MDNVRPAKVTELKTAVAEAYQVYMNEDATADEIRAAIRTLSEKAQELWLIVSKAELNALIESADVYKRQEGVTALFLWQGERRMTVRSIGICSTYTLISLVHLFGQIRADSAVLRYQCFISCRIN